MDTEINTFWFNNPDYWFVKDDTIRNTIDKLLYDKYYTWWQTINNMNIINFTNNKDTCLAAILALDQLSRHFNRLIPSVDIVETTKKALKITYHILHEKWDTEYPAAARMFVLLPLRHSGIIYNIKLSISITINYINNTSYPIYYRFLRASLLKLYELSPLTNEICCLNDNYSTVLESPLMDSKLYDIINISDPLYKIIDNWLNANYNSQPNINISLSGGVDSMVLCSIIHALKDKYNYTCNALHINYNNRPESCLETKFLQSWCQVRNIPFYVRNITLIKRENCDRVFYEDITRDIRFDFYKRFPGPVILGHTHDDIIENILNNIMNSSNFDNLYGMDTSRVINNVNIWRPLLFTKKIDIYKFSQTYKIPYFKNTTPDWSVRGKLRNHFLPALINQYGKTAPNSLVFLAETMQQNDTLIKTHIILPFIDKIKWPTNRNCIIDTSDHLNSGFNFWRTVVYSICNKANYTPLPSKKSIVNFINRINNVTSSITQITLTPSIKITKNKKILYITFP